MSSSPYNYTFDPDGDSTAARVVRSVGNGKSVLELGCAYGVMTKVLAERSNCRVFGIEYNAESAQHARPYCEELVVADLEQIDLREILGSRRFDVIVAADILEHLRNPAQQLAALKKFLNPNGYVVLSIPNVAHNGVVAELLNEDFRYRETGLLDSTHLRFWGPQGIRRLVEDSGFVIRSVETSTLDVEQSEFASSWQHLPELIKTIFQARANGSAYQFIVTAAPNELSTAVNWPPETEKLNVGAADVRILEAEQRRIESEIAREQLEQQVMFLSKTIDEMKATHTWRWTRWLRFLARLRKSGLTTDDRNRLRIGYHRLPLPPKLKQVISFIAHQVIGRSISRVRSFVRGLTTFRPPAVRPSPQNKELPDYIVWGVIDWHFRHQRPQQLAKALAETGRRVFYIAPNFKVDSRAGFEAEQLDANGRVFQVTLFNNSSPDVYSNAPNESTVEQLRKSVGELLMWTDTSKIVSTVQHPFWLDIASVLPDSRLVYDCMDHHEGFKNTGASLVQLEKELFKKADLTVTTSSWLDKSVEAFASRKVVVRNAGDFRHFSAKPIKVFKDPAGRKILGYYGAIAEWFDLELLEVLAQKFSDCLIVLVGDDTIRAKPRLSKHRNIKFIGEVPYNELPYYLHSFDVCLLPFKVVPLTLATNPVKAYEYLAAGKPVVAPALPEMAQFNDLVSVAKDQTEFVNAVSAVLSKIESPTLTERRRKFAQHETWSERAAALIANAETSVGDSKVSVVVVTYNNLELTRACLASLDANSNYENLEIIVVDNASSDESPDFLKSWAANGENRRLILNSENRGFAAANNQGLAVATGEYLAMLNNDTFVTPGWIRTLVNHLKRDHGIGLIGPVTGNIGNEAKIDIRYSNMTEMVAESRAYTRRHVGRTYPLRTAAFFCVMLRKQTFDRVGPLDEIFGRGFFEDDDYCRRVEKIGLRIVCADDVFIHHHLSASFNKLKQKDRELLFQENKKLYEAKWGEWIPHDYRRHAGTSRAPT